MFKKPLSTMKTSAPLRGSDRKKLRKRVETAHGLSTEEADLLVPDGTLSLKFDTHLKEPGILYLSPDGDPIWFTLGKGSEDLIPTVYTLWKRPMLPFLSTPAAVIPVLVGGADLMIPGVVHLSPALKESQLVSICQYNRGDQTLSPPLAVGRMALSSDQIQSGRQEKGKAVYVVHTWKDHLWDMGSKADVPESTPLTAAAAAAAESELADEDGGDAADEPSASPPPPSEPPDVPDVPKDANPAPSVSAYTPAEVSTLLHESLLQALSTALSDLPASSFPISASNFYSTYVLPYRPVFPGSILSNGDEDNKEMEPQTNPQEITIKTSGHKSLTAFLKSAEKLSLLTLKAPPKHGQQTESVVASVNSTHPAVVAHKSFVTVRDLETRAAKKALREERLKEAEEDAGRWVEVRELWKPHLKSLELFEALGGSAKTLYELTEIRTLLNGYISSNNLVNPREQAYINLDPLLSNTITSKGKSKKGAAAPEEPVEFMKRDELTRNVVEQMQPWSEVKAPGRDVVVKKGALKPIQVVMKMRQGRKASTLISGFEPFLVLSADEMAEDLRKICAGATSVSPRVGGTPGMEVLVQGKQSKILYDYLTEKGIPKKWIEISDLIGKK